MCHGSDGGIKLIFESFLNSKDKLLLTNPTFQMYSVYSKIFNSKTKLINYKNLNGIPFLGIDEILNYIKKFKPKVFFLANPNSPTGTIFDLNNLNKIALMCKKSNTILGIDEAYYPYSEITGVNLIKKFNNVLIIRSFSKAWGLAGLRIGYVIGNKEIINFLHKNKPMYEINSLANEVLLKLLDSYKDVKISIESLKSGKKYFVEKMLKNGCETFISHANFFHLKIPSSILTKLNNFIVFKKSFDHPCLKGYSSFSAAPKATYKKIVKEIFAK